MKKAIFIILLLIISINGYSQETEGKRPVYCNIMGYNFWGFGKVKVQLDMGDYTNNKGFDAIYEADGKKKKFNTMMEVLNYMGERGWKVIGTYYITESPGHHIIHYLLEKWIADESQRKEGLILKEDRESLIKEKEREDDTYYTPKKKEKAENNEE